MAQQSNATTLIAVFDDFATAQQASRELFSQGFQQEDIQIQSNMKTGAAGHGNSGDYHEPGDGESGITGWFHRILGFNEQDNETGHYAEAVRRGSAVLSATVPESQVDEVTATLNRFGAIDIDQRAASWRETGYTGYDPKAENYSYDEAARERAQYGSKNDTTVPVIEEELQVGKRSVPRGGVRVYSRMVNQPVEEQISLREEHVRVERRPIDRLVSDAEISQLRDQTIEVTEMAEEPVVSKRARIKEEIVVGKQATERTETVRGNVRHTEVLIDQMDSATADQSGGDAAYDYGYRAAGNSTFRGRSWSDAENDLRADYLRNNPGGKWEEAKSGIRRGWDKVTGKL